MYRETVLHCVSKKRLGKTCVLRGGLRNLQVGLHLIFKDKNNLFFFVKTHIVPLSNVAEHQWPVDHPLFEGIPVLQPSRFYPCPSSVTASKLYQDTTFGFFWHCFPQNLWFHCGDYRPSWGPFYAMEIRGFGGEFWNRLAKEMRRLSFSDQTVEGNFCVCRPAEWGVDVHSGRIERSVVFSGYRSQQDQDCGLWW